MAEKGFDITKYITAEDIVAAVAAGVVAYIRNRPKVDDKKQQPPGDAAQAAQQAAPTPKGPTWGSQDWRDEMVRQGKLVQRDGIYFRVNRSGQPLEAYKFFKGGSYAKMPIADVDDALVNGPEDWWDFDKAGAVLVSPDGTAQKLDPDFLGRLEGVLDKNFGGKDAMNAIGKEVRQAAAAASGLDPEVAAARGLHDGTGRAFTSLGSSPAAGPAATGIPSKVTITNKALANELLSGPSPTSVWKPDGSFDISAVHWKSVPGRGMLPFGPDKQPLTGKALAAAQQLGRQAAASARASMGT